VADSAQRNEHYANIRQTWIFGENSLRAWLKQADIDEGRGPAGKLTTSVVLHRELRHLRRKVRTLEMEREFLKKAAAYFAQNKTAHTK
jgi:transposase